MTAPNLTPTAVDRVESTIARDLARHALLAAPVLIVALGLWRGADSAGAVALALAIVCVNWLVSAAMLGWGARTPPNVLMAAALGGFSPWVVAVRSMAGGSKHTAI